jgi:F-type H+-transporting ATPase subunit epsilon
MADKINLTIVAPDRILFKGVVEDVYAKGVLGEFGILESHAPYFSETEPGQVRFRTGGAERTAAVAEGYAAVAADNVTLLVEAAEFPEEIDVSRAREYLKRAEEKLKGLNLYDAEYRFWDLRRMRAENRMLSAGSVKTSVKHSA